MMLLWLRQWGGTIICIIGKRAKNQINKELLVLAWTKAEVWAKHSGYNLSYGILTIETILCHKFWN